MSDVFNSVILRETADNFGALVIADAMQSVAGVEVISVVCQSPRHADVMSDKCTRPERWYVFAKYDSASITPDAIDAAISAALSR